MGKNSIMNAIRILALILLVMSAASMMMSAWSYNTACPNSKHVVNNVCGRIMPASFLATVATFIVALILALCVDAVDE